MALPVVERAWRQDSKPDPPPSPCELAAAFNRYMMRKMIRFENHQDLLIDEQTWQAINDPKTADLIARGLFIFKGAIDSGHEGAREASDAILADIEAAYLHTDAHRAAVRLYLLSLTGQLKPEDEPLQLINGAIERGVARIEVARKGRAKKKRRR